MARVKVLALGFAVAGALSDGARDLRIVGCGVLGRCAGSQWLAAYPGARVVGETRSRLRHDDLLSIGIQPVTRSERKSEAKCAYLIYCAPPSAFESGEEYAQEVCLAAAECWTGAGGFVLTSSGGVFAEDCGGTCNEISPTLKTERASKLLMAEAAARGSGGAVIRLAGLYALKRGAHQFWFTKGTVEAKDDSLVNLITYEDAAACCVAACLRGAPGDLFLAADMQPRTRQQIVEAAKRHPDFQDRTVTFTQAPLNSRGPKNFGRRYDCSYTRTKLKWKPRFPNVETFFENEAFRTATEST